MSLYSSIDNLNNKLKEQKDDLIKFRDSDNRLKNRYGDTIDPIKFLNPPYGKAITLSDMVVNGQVDETNSLNYKTDGFVETIPVNQTLDFDKHGRVTLILEQEIFIKYSGSVSIDFTDDNILHGLQAVAFIFNNNTLPLSETPIINTNGIDDIIDIYIGRANHRRSSAYSADTINNPLFNFRNVNRDYSSYLPLIENIQFLTRDITPNTRPDPQAILKTKSIITFSKINGFLLQCSIRTDVSQIETPHDFGTRDINQKISVSNSYIQRIYTNNADNKLGINENSLEIKDLLLNYPKYTFFNSTVPNEFKVVPSFNYKRKLRYA